MRKLMALYIVAFLLAVAFLRVDDVFRAEASSVSQKSKTKRLRSLDLQLS